MSIELFNVSKNYSGTYAVKDISLRFEDGKTTILIGQSGCGKSTLIRIITSLIKPDSGKVIIDGEILSEENLLKIRRRIGYVIQDGGLFPHLSAFDNVILLAKYLGVDNKKIDNKVEQLAALTKFPTDKLSRFPSQLSGGQKQRVSLMRALMLDPEILLLDEPLGALDPMIRFDLQTDLKEIFSSLNKTVVMVTHDMNEAAYFGDEIVLMKNGSVVQKGILKELVNQPKEDYVKQFINTQRNLID